MSTNTSKRGHDVPMYPPRTPAEYIAGQQEANVQLTSFADMLTWAQNYARSRSIWPLGYGLACRSVRFYPRMLFHSTATWSNHLSAMSFRLGA